MVFHYIQIVMCVLDVCYRKKLIFLGIKQSKKNCFLLKFAANFLLFSGFLQQKRWKWLFRPAFRVRSTQTLVKIYNMCVCKYLGSKDGEKTVIKMCVKVKLVVSMNKPSNVYWNNKGHLMPQTKKYYLSFFLSFFLSFYTL